METWREWEDINDRFKRRTYKDYDQYMEVQRQKLDIAHGTARRFSDGQRGGLGKRLQHKFVDIGKTALCLGARLGGEVQAFLDNGILAVGVDLNPGDNNPYVLYGDFHQLVFPDQSFDIVYTNSLDHALDLKKVISEMIRVLKPFGHAIIESKGGTQEPGFRPAKSDSYDCMEWKAHQDLIDLFVETGFDVIEQYRCKGFTPWGVLYQKPK